MEIIKLNIIPSGVNPTCHASQYDEGRVIRVELFEGLTPFTLQANDEIGLSIRKPDDKIVTMLVENTQNNYVDIVTTKQACAVVGANLCELTIKRNSVNIGTLNFYMQVERDPLSDGDPSESDIRDLQERVNACVEIALEDLYDGTSVLFDSEPVVNHNAPYTVTSNGIAAALAGKANVSALNDYYTKQETYNKTELNNTFNTINTALDQKADTSSLAAVATSGNYNDLTNKPNVQVFTRNDVLLNAAGGTLRGFGSAVITMYNGIARIDFNIKISVDETVSNIGSWGINRDYFTALVGKVITPLPAGVVTYYNNEQVYASRTDFGGTFLVDNQFWKPARVYDDNGTKKVGGWVSSNFASGQRFIGTCYGTYT